jgi:simple sugar transport system substrate-binding protein
MGHSDKNVEDFAPDVFFAAPYAKWGPFFVERAQAVIDGTWESQGVFATTGDGITNIYLSKKNVSAEAKAEVKALRKQIADGSLVVFTGPINAQDGSEIVAAGEEGDLEVLSGLFVEGVIGDFPEEE